MIWFRHYVGLCRDPKMVAVATRSAQPVERVVWVFCAILESASDRNGPEHRFEAAEAAYFLRCEVSDVEAILEAMEGKMIVGGKVINWDRRQYKSDTSTPRVQAHRKRKRKQVKRSGNVSVTTCNVSETAPDTDTEADTESERSREVNLEKNPNDEVLTPTRARGANPAAVVGGNSEIPPDRAKTALKTLKESDRGKDRPRSEPQPIGGMLGSKPRSHGSPVNGESLANWIMATWNVSGFNGSARSPTIRDAEQIADVLMREGPRSQITQAATRMVEVLADEAKEKRLKDPLGYLFGVLSKGGLERWLAKETKAERKAKESAALKAGLEAGRKMAEERRR